MKALAHSQQHPILRAVLCPSNVQDIFNVGHGQNDLKGILPRGFYRLFMKELPGFICGGSTMAHVAWALYLSEMKCTLCVAAVTSRSSETGVPYQDFKMLNIDRLMDG